MRYARVIKMGTEVECISKYSLFSAVVVGYTEGNLFPLFEGRTKCPWCSPNLLLFFFLGILAVTCNLSVPLQSTVQ